MTTPDTPMDPMALPRSVSRPVTLASAIIAIGLLALISWATLAPLATTIRASGTLVSGHPAYEIQHPYGGRIAEVLVTPQAAVKKGDLLIRLDVSTQRRSLDLLREQIDRLEVENYVIRDILGLKQTGPAIGENDPVVTSARARFRAMHDRLTLDLRSAEETQNTAQVRAQATQRSLENLRLRVAAMQERAVGRKRLVKRGIISKTDAASQEDQQLALQAHLEVQSGELAGLQAEAQAAELQAQRLRAQFRLTLLERLDQNAERLPGLRRQAVDLGAEIDAANIRATISGTIVALDYDTDAMYVPRGTTLLKLSQSLSAPAVTLRIPPTAIDQVHPGMTGQLTIPSLPQRNLPRINVTLDAVAPDAMKDRDGRTLGYAARASIPPDQLSALMSALAGDLHLATDMPVSVALKGRETTFARYLFAPFFRMFSGALQD